MREEFADRGLLAVVQGAYADAPLIRERQRLVEIRWIFSVLGGYGIHHCFKTPSFGLGVRPVPSLFYEAFASRLPATRLRPPRFAR